MPSGLNIKNPEVLRLVEEVAHLTGESKTEAIRSALAERKRRLGGDTRSRRDRLDEWLMEFHKTLPPGILGRPISKAEREEILGIGPHGYPE